MGHPALARRAIADSSASRRRNDKNARTNARTKEAGRNWIPRWAEVPRWGRSGCRSGL